jgi:hypothetical protein
VKGVNPRKDVLRYEKPTLKNHQGRRAEVVAGIPSVQEPEKEGKGINMSYRDAWTDEVDRLRKENAQLKDDNRILKNIRSIRTEERDRWKQLYHDLVETNKLLRDMTGRKN